MILASLLLAAAAAKTALISYQPGNPDGSVQLAVPPAEAKRLLAQLFPHRLHDPTESPENAGTPAQAYEAALPDLRSFIKTYEAALKGFFGAGSVQLLDFGIKPAGKPATRTTAQKAVSAALAKQKRTVRGTAGKKQKAAITTQGKPGLVLVTATGTPIPGGVPGPTPPGTGVPVDVTAAVAGSTGTASGSAASTTPGSGSKK